MSRVIRLDDAIATIAGQMSYEIEAETGEKTDCLDLAEELLNDIPTIDAVSVVRKPIKGYEGYYEVDQFGRVFSVDRVIRVNDNGREYDKPIKGGQLKQHMHSKGYKIVCLTKNGKSKNVYVHRLVAEAFVENPSGLPLINHIDEDKTNNFADNLEWCTNEYNVNYGKGKERRAKKIRGRALSEEHKQKISEGLRRYHGERSDR